MESKVEIQKNPRPWQNIARMLDQPILMPYLFFDFLVKGAQRDSGSIQHPVHIEEDKNHPLFL